MGAAAGWKPNPEGGSVFLLDLPSGPEGAAKSL